MARGLDVDAAHAGARPAAAPSLKSPLLPVGQVPDGAESSCGYADGAAPAGAGSWRRPSPDRKTLPQGKHACSGTTPEGAGSGEDDPVESDCGGDSGDDLAAVAAGFKRSMAGPAALLHAGRGQLGKVGSGVAPQGMEDGPAGAGNDQPLIYKDLDGGVVAQRLRPRLSVEEARRLASFVATPAWLAQPLALHAPHTPLAGAAPARRRQRMGGAP